MQSTTKTSTTKTSTTKTSTNKQKSNIKTVLCKFYGRDGHCPFEEKCNYAHGLAELNHRKPRKIQSPCWYYNKQGCSKSADECIYLHVSAPDMRKPIHLQHPCPFFHYKTPLCCRRGDQCSGDHSYELTAEEWKHHFPGLEYPGAGYLTRPRASDPKEEFPVLGQPKPKSVSGGVWGRPLSFKSAKPSSNHKPVQRSQKSVTQHHPTIPPPPMVYNPLIGRSWADVDEENEDPILIAARIQDEWWGCEEPKKETTEFQNQLTELQSQVTHITNQLVAEKKIPAMDGDIRSLATTALKELLDSIQ